MRGSAGATTSLAGASFASMSSPGATGAGSAGGVVNTASRRSAQLLSSAADSAATQVFIKRYDPKTDHFTYTEVNENFAADLGLSPAEVIGHSDEDLHTPDAAERFHAQDVSVMTSGSMAANIRRCISA